MRVLTVTNQFGDYKKGDRIEDADQIAAVLASENSVNVVPTEVPDAPPAPTGKKSAKGADAS